MAKTRKYAVMLAYAENPKCARYEVEAESFDAAEREALWEFEKEIPFSDFTNIIVQADWITDITEDEDGNGENADTSEDA